MTASELLADLMSAIRRIDPQEIAEIFLNRQMAQEFAAALFTFIVGWIFSLRVGRQRRKDRLAEELIASQREMLGWAYPETRGEEWRQRGQREARMLDPFVSRIRFLIQSMNEDMTVKLSAQDALDRYIVAKERFILKWSETSNRGVGYHEAYKATYLRLREAVQLLSPAQMRKLRGLLPERFMMDALLPPVPRRRSPPPRPSEEGSDLLQN